MKEPFRYSLQLANCYLFFLDFTTVTICVYHHSSQPSNSLSQGVSANAASSICLSLSLLVFRNHFLFTFFFINFLFLLFLGILLARRELQTVVEYVLSNRVNLDSYLSFFALINNSFYVIFLIDDEYILL